MQRDITPNKQVLHRELSREAIRAIDPETRTVELAFSSELPYERWFGMEILDHSAKSVRMDRLQNAAAVLVNHKTDDQVGVVVNASIGADRVGRAVVKFGRSQRATEIFQDVQDGIRQLVSVGYMVNDMKLEKSSGGMDTYRVTDWTPFEVSIVSIPADPSVGVGRSADEFDPRSFFTGEHPMTTAATTPPTETRADPVIGPGASGVPADPNPAPAPGHARVEGVRHGDFLLDPATVERDRIQYISRLCDQHGVRPEQREAWIMSGTAVDQVSNQILAMIAERQRSAATSVSMLNMSGNDTEKYSLFKALNAVKTGRWEKAGFELECHRAVAAKVDKPVGEHTIFVPADVLMRSMPVKRMMGASRDISVAASGGGNLVQTDLVSFIDLLRNRSVVAAMGATFLSGLQGNISIPKQLTASTASWLANETTAAPESQPTIGQVSMTPKTVAGYVELSRLLMMQASYDAELLVWNDLAKQVALAADLAALNGDGTGGSPVGVLQAAGIGSVTGTTLGYAGIIEFQTDVAASNALVAGCGYVSTPAVAGLLKGRQRFASTDTPLWQGNILDGTIEGFRAMTSNQMPAATMVFGDFSQVVIGEWGVLELEANPYANFQAAITGVRALYTMDVAVRIAAAFSRAATIT